MTDIAPSLDPRSSAGDGDAASALTEEVSTRRLATASSVGTTLEWYDFTVYNTLAALIFNQLFFPSFDPVTGTILAFSTYAVGYVSRPIGGFWFGHLGDQRGRRFVLVATVIVMGATSALIGVLPTYATAGVLSPILLVTLRFAQGVALGGEWAGAVLISVEHGAPNKRGRNGSFTQVGPACGTLLATGAIALLTYLLSPDAFLAWGWRIPFLASMGLVVFGIWIRSGVGETPLFKELEQAGAKAKAPIADVLRLHWRRLLIAGGVRIGSDVLYSLVFVFSLTYVTTILQLPRSLPLTAIMIATPINALMILVFGTLSDRIGRRPVYAAGAVLGMLWSVVFFMLLETRSSVLIVLAVIVGVTIHAAMFGPQAAFVIEQFPTRVRYAGSSLAYTLAGILGAGFAPLIMTTALRASGTWIVISIYVAVALAITLLALAAARETANRPLAD
jgi:MFS family permease